MKAWLPNALAFQVVWFAAVGGAGRGWWWCGPLALAVFAAWQLAPSRRARGDASLALVAGAGGYLVDSGWVWSGLMTFAAPVPAGMAPAWIVSLWVAYALTLNHSLAGLKAHPAWAALLGAAGGPLAYGVAEHAWQAVALARPAWMPLLALSVAWGLLTPTLLCLAARWEHARPRLMAVR